MLVVAFDEFRQDKEVMADMVKVKPMVTEGKGANAELMEVVRIIWGTLCTDDAGILSQSLGSLQKVISIIGRERCGLACWSQNPRWRSCACFITKRMKACSFTVNAAGMAFGQMEKKLCVSGPRSPRTAESVEDEINN